MVCRLKAEHEQAAARTIADIVPFDLGRIENATIGGIQTRLTEQTNRLHSILKFSKCTAVEARYTGRCCKRIQASVMIPRIPSEPINMRSGLGPAPTLAGGVKRQSRSG